MTRDLVVMERTPVLGTGGGMRSYGVVRALATLRPVDVLFAVFGADEPAAEFRSIPGVALHPLERGRDLRRGVAYLRARAASLPDGFARGVPGELGRAAARFAGQPGRGLVVADGPQAAAALLPLARRRPVVYNAHNVESSFRAGFEGAHPRDALRLDAFERRVLERVAEAWMVSPRDMQLARELAPGAALRYVPNVVDVGAIAPLDPDRNARTALFLADFRYQPNRCGLRFLLDDVMPRVWREVPDARLRLAGRGLELGSNTNERVEAVGFVASPRDAYAGVSCATVPLLVGGGSPLKFVEALAYGVPVVATPVAAAGLEVRDGEHFRCAEDAEAFAAVLVDLLRAGDGGLGARGRALAEREYSIEALAGRLRAPRHHGRIA